MSENNIFKRFFSSFTIQVAFTLFGVIGTAITIFAFLQVKKVDLRYEVIANTNVLDFNADVSKLEVIYDSTNLKQTQENLRIYTVKVINGGGEHITKDLYDVNEPLGIQISSGKLIEQPQLIQTSNEYLARNLKMVNFRNNSINFSQVIIESEESFTLKLLVLHSKDSIPSIICLGKIAGQKNIKIDNNIEKNEKLISIDQVLGGNVIVQLLRGFIYSIFGFTILATVLSVYAAIDILIVKQKKKSLIQEFKDSNATQYQKSNEHIFDIYLKTTFSYLQTISSELQSAEDIIDFVRNRTLSKISEKAGNQAISDEQLLNELLPQEKISVPLFENQLIFSLGFIYKSGNNYMVNQPLKETLTKFIAFLINKGYTKR
jgi:hypothetical protein